MNLLKEENNELTLLVPKCGKCDYIMSGIHHRFYKNPSFNETEFMSSITWVELKYQCPKCGGQMSLSQEELDKLNSYPGDKVNYPPGFIKNMKLTRMMSK